MASTRAKTSQASQSVQSGNDVAVSGNGRTFADVLQSTLYERELSQRDAANEIGVTRQLVNDWIHRRRKPGKQHTARVAAWLGVSTEDVLRMTGRTVEPNIEERLDALERQIEELRTLVVSRFATENRPQRRRK